METFRLIIQILLLVFLLAIAAGTIWQRKSYSSLFEFRTNLIATLLLILWLLLAGSFDRFLW